MEEDKAVKKIDSSMPEPEMSNELVNTPSDSPNSSEEYELLKKGFLEEKKKMEDRMWLDMNLNRFDEVLRANFDSSVQTFSEKVITYISKLIDAVYGAFFVVNHDEKFVEAKAGYACTVETMDRVRFQFGEGLIGQVVKTQNTLCLDNIETNLDSSVGRISASSMVILPLIFNESVCGIIELNTLAKPKPKTLILLDRMSKSTAAVLQSILNNQNTKRLLIDGYQYSEEFKSLQKELNQRAEELEALQKELAEKEAQLAELLGGQTSSLTSLEGEAESSQAWVGLQEKLASKEAEAEELKRTIQSLEAEQKEDKPGAQSEVAQLEESLVKMHVALNEAQSKLEKYEESASQNAEEDPELQGDKKGEMEEYHTQIEELKRELSQSQANLDRRIQEQDMLKETIKWKDEEIDRQDEAIVEKKRTLQSLKKEMDDITTENIKQVEEIVSLQKELKQKAEEIEGLQDQAANEEQEEVLRVLESRLAQKESELSDLNEDLQQYQAQVSEFEAKIEQLENELKNKEEEIARLEEDLSNAEARNEEQNEALNQALAKLNKKEDELLVSQYLLNQQSETSSDEILTNLKEQLSLKEKEISQLSAEIAEKEAEWTKELEKLQAQMKEGSSDLESEILSYQEEIEKLQQELEKSNKSENSESQEEIEQYKTQIEELEQQLEAYDPDEITTLQEKIAQLESGQEGGEGENSASAETITRLQIEITNLKEQLASASSTDSESEIQDLQETMTQLKSEIESKNEMISSLHEEIEEKMLVLEETEVSSLQEKLLEKEAEFNRLTEAHNLQVEALEALKEDLAKANSEIENLQSTENSSEEGDASREEFEQALEELQRKEQELLQKNEALSTLRNQLLEKEKRLEALENRNPESGEVSAEELDAFNQKLDDLEKIQRDLQEKEQEITRQTAIIRTQKSEILEQRQELEGLRDVLGNKEQENVKQAGQIHNQQEQLLSRQNELKQKEKELTSLFNKINTAFSALEFDMDGTVLSINNKFLMLLGLKLQDIEGQALKGLLPEGYTESSEYRVLWEGLKMGATEVIEHFVCIGSKGREIKMSVTFIPILGDDSRPYEVVLLVNQVYPEILESEESASSTSEGGTNSGELSQEASEKLRALDNSFAILELDLQGVVLSVNYQFLTNLGYEKEDVLGKHHRSFLDITERSSEEYIEIIKGLSSGNFANRVFKYVGKEGERMRFRSVFNPILDKDGNPEKVLVISQFAR